jgi:hypothetical protein
VVFLVLFCFYLDLLCKRVLSSLCIGSTVMALFIKRGESLFRGIVNKQLFSLQQVSAQRIIFLWTYVMVMSAGPRLSKDNLVSRTISMSRYVYVRAARI